MTTKPNNGSPDGVAPLIALANVALVGVPAAYASTRSITIAVIAAVVIVLAHTLGRPR